MHKLFEIHSITLFLCAFCAFLWLKNPFNQRNPRLMKYLRAYKAHSTTVEESLQINSFMQNKAKFRKSQMNVSSILTKDYDKKTLGGSGKNEPKTNPNEPNQSQLKPIQSQNKPNTNPIKPNFKGKKCCRV